MSTADTSWKTIAYAVEAGVATITLSRPDKLNAVDTHMQRELLAALATASRDDAVRAIVLTGKGRGFCVGQDLAEVGAVGDGFRIDEHVRTTYNRLVLTMTGMDKPIIAAVNGVAAGAGASIALACDMRVAGESASFIQGFVKIGLVPDTGSTWLLPRLVGLSRAIELATTGRTVQAEEALALGLVGEVVPDDRLLQAAQAMAAELAKLPTRAIGMTKRAIYRATGTTLADALEHEAQLQQAAAHTADHAEGVAAFLEKREPAFTGR